MKTKGGFPAVLVVCASLFAHMSSAQPVEVRGEAILKHPVGMLAMKMAELMEAGKIDDVMALRTSTELADWKGASDADRKEMSGLIQMRGPEPAAFAKALRKDGVLIVRTDEAELQADMKAEGTAVAYFKLEGSKWRGISGPIVIGRPEEPANETRVYGAMILDHPIAAIALEYINLVHGGKMDEAMKLASGEAQGRWKALPAGEKKESAAFRKKVLPEGKTLRSAIESGGVLIVEDDNRATLNLVVTEQTSSEPGVVTSSSSTVALPFVLEAGKWKVAR